MSNLVAGGALEGHCSRCGTWKELPAVNSGRCRSCVIEAAEEAACWRLAAVERLAKGIFGSYEMTGPAGAWTMPWLGYQTAVAWGPIHDWPRLSMTSLSCPPED